jgi:CDP-diacylglycerol--glycerol-3-phosphate 3-phosphatidyltransferase
VIEQAVHLPTVVTHRRINWPMGLTMLRLLLLPLFVWALLKSGADRGIASNDAGYFRWMAIGLFAFMALTDKLDGYLARRLNQMTRLGAILDPIADKLLIGAALLLLSFSWIAPAGCAVPVPVLLAVYGKDIGNTLGGLALFAAVGRAEIASSMLGRISMVAQFVLVTMTMLGGELSRISPVGTSWLLYFLQWCVFLAALGTTVDYVEEASHQYAQHRRRMVRLAA